jgi:hypothetical protein
MNKITRSSSKLRRVAVKPLVILVVFISLSLSFGAVVRALSETSPNPNGIDFIAGGDNKGISHLLKNEVNDANVVIAQVLETNVDIYYDSPGAVTGNPLKIFYNPRLSEAAGDKKCSIDAPNLNLANTNLQGAIRVTVSSEGGASYTYRVSKGKICDDRSGHANDEANTGNNNKFFANYKLPAPTPDAKSGRYKLSVNILYNLQAAPNNKGSVNFGLNAGGGTISPKGNADATQFGLRSSYVFQSPPRDVQVGVQFGKPCDNNDFRTSVRLYDADVNAFGPTYVWVEEDGQPVAYERYRIPNTSQYDVNNATMDGGNGRWRSTANASNTNTRLTFTDFKKNSKYKFKIYNPVDPTKLSPNSNVLSISIPHGSIYGDIKCNFNFDPNTSVSPKTYPLYPSLNVTSTVSGNSGPTDPGVHDWATFIAKYTPGSDTSMTKGDEPGLSFIDICNRRVPTTGRTSCNLLGLEKYPASGQSKSYTHTSATPDPVGTKICFFSVFQNPQVDEASGYQTDDNTWRYSTMDCSVAAKKPQVQFLGGDLKIQGNVSAGPTETKAPDGSTKTFGSWVEYGLFSTGTNNIASSGAGLKNGNPSSSKGEWSKLTFANKMSSYGSYSPLALSTARSFFAGLQSTGSTVNTGQSGVYDIGTASIGGATNIDIAESSKGRSLIVRGNDITIDGNITVNNTNRQNTGEISQIVILAHNIKIQDNVTNIDAWLLTTGSDGTIDTCSNVVTTLDATKCSQVLTVNGAVMTSRLYLKRTAGADANTPQSAAEVFRLRPDAQLWAYKYANTSDRAQTVYVQELPPRF